MKTIKMLPVLLLLVLGSCASVSVSSDHDTNTDFSKYKTYAFLKNSIDKVEISDLDKRRILAAIETEMNAKGFTKSDNPDLLVSFFTKSTQQVNVNNYSPAWGWGWGWGWGPGMWGGYSSVSTNTEGTLYIDFIDAARKELIGQGEGRGTLTRDAVKKDEKVREFVSRILSQYPPEKRK